MSEIFAIHFVAANKSRIFRLLEILLKFSRYKVAVQYDDYLANKGFLKVGESYVADANEEIIEGLSELFEGNNLFLACSGDGGFHQIIDMYLFGFY